MGWIAIPADRAFNGNGAPGDFLEHLLGGSRNNRDSPDLNDWEIKFHGGNALLTLFHKEPQPRGISRLLVHEHGWPDHLERLSFRHTLGGSSNKGFTVHNEADRIVVRHDVKDTIVPYWTHNNLLNAAVAKLRRLIVVDGEMNQTERKVIYRTATAYWDFNINGFINALVDGKVFIDFDARTKAGPGTALRNHGTKFRIGVNDIPQLYDHRQIIPN